MSRNAQEKQNQIILGISPMKNTPENKKVGYVIAIILVTVLVTFVVGLVLASTLMKALV